MTFTITDNFFFLIITKYPGLCLNLVANPKDRFYHNKTHLIGYFLILVVEDQGHSSMETETQSDICLVHSLAWMSTYQFVLNQIINREMLMGVCGHEFSNKICTCNNGQGNTGRGNFDMTLSSVARKPVFGVSDKVRHKPGCAATEDGWRLEILDLGSRGFYYLCFYYLWFYYLWSKNKGAAQLHGYRAADLHLCFCICKKQIFS